LPFLQQFLSFWSGLVQDQAPSPAWIHYRLPSPSLPDPFVPTPSYALDLFAPPRVEIGFLSGFCFLFFGFLFYPAFLYFSGCFWGSLCPCLGLPAFGILQPST
jgi:hypothetical protein